MTYYKKFIHISLALLILFSLVTGNTSKVQDFNFFQAVEKGDLEAVEVMIKDNPCLVNTEDQRGCTAIFHAIIKKNRDIVKLLIRNGALLRVGDHDLRAPVHYAGFMDDTAMVQLLLDNGAVIDSRAIGAATPLIHSSLSNRTELSRFLVNNGADINIQCNSLTTPLYFAVLNDNQDYLTFLLENGADIDTSDFLDRTPLHIAVRDGYTEMVSRLIGQGADYRVKDKHSGRGLLHLAAIQGHEKIAGILIDNGLDVNIRDGRNYTPADYACRYGQGRLSEFLKQRGGRTQKIKEPAVKEAVWGGTLNYGEARIIKLQNGSWGIKTRNRFLVFAYSETGRPPSEKSLLNGYITVKEMTGESLVYLDLGFHTQRARYALQGQNPIYSIQDRLKNVSFILNADFKDYYRQYKLENARFPRLKETLETDGIRVNAIPSYLYNMGYFLECDGLNIFWLSAVSDSYLSAKKDLRAIEYVAEHFPRIDILILGSPSGIGPERGNQTRTAYMEAEKLNPRAVFFMGKPPLERRIYRQVKRRIQNPGNIWVAENPGDRFFYSKGKIKGD